MILKAYVNCCEVYAEKILEARNKGRDPEPLKRQYEHFYKCAKDEAARRADNMTLSAADMRHIRQLMTVQNKKVNAL